MSVQEAERACLERARGASGPHGTAAVGMNSRGHTAGRLDVTISSDYLLGRDPSALYDACVQQKSGQLPTRPLYSRSDWKG